MTQHRQVLWPNDVIVKRVLEWEDGPENRAVLLVPRFRKGFLAKWLQPKLKRPYMRVKLDDVGSFVWRKCDGQTNYATLVDRMRQQFGEKIEPAEDRLQRFLTTLYKSNFVEMFKP